MLKSSPIYLLSKYLKTKSWLWHHRLSHLNFGTINQLAKECLVKDLPKLKYEKDHLCSACSLGKSKKYTHKPKSENSIQEKLYVLHMDLCGPMRVESINGKKYILVVVDDYSRFTWVKFLRSNDETYEFIINFLKQVQVRLNATVRNIRRDNGTEFKGVVKRQNQTLVETARTMLIFSKASLFLWAEVVATAYLKYLHVFSALCYLTNNSEDLGKLKPKADIGIFIGYSHAKKEYWIYNKRKILIMETIHVEFDELKEMASEQFSSGPKSQLLTSGLIRLGLPLPSVVSIVPPAAAPIPAHTTDDVFKEDVDYPSSRRLCNLSFLDYLTLYFFEYEHVVLNSTCHGLDAAAIGKPACLEFRRISLTGFRSCTSRSHYRSISKQTIRYE
ncbi:retrovirus-related pol polyprotein from transposon TNT 1-94 [Tanacetum coccineum]